MTEVDVGITGELRMFRLSIGEPDEGDSVIEAMAKNGPEITFADREQDAEQGRKLNDDDCRSKTLVEMYDARH